LITTFIARRNESHRSDLVSKLDTNNPDVMNRINGMANSFMSKGLDSKAALGTAYRAMDYSIAKQAVVMSYMEVFLYLGVLFLICIPLMLLVKSNKQKGKLDASAMH
jgi:DHA2 family multidrug resistance protein